MKDLTGKSFGYLKVSARAEKNKGQRSRPWICVCECGNTIEMGSSVLSSGKNASCGCHPGLTLSGYRLVITMRRHHQWLCKSLPKEGGSLRYFLEPSGKDINRFAANSAIAAGELKPLGDGLFAETSQTWVAA
jgi:hypothetical protein